RAGDKTAHVVFPRVVLADSQQAGGDARITTNQVVETRVDIGDDDIRRKQLVNGLKMWAPSWPWLAKVDVQEERLSSLRPHQHFPKWSQVHHLRKHTEISAQLIKRPRLVRVIVVIENGIHRGICELVKDNCLIFRCNQLTLVSDLWKPQSQRSAQASYEES